MQKQMQNVGNKLHFYPVEQSKDGKKKSIIIIINYYFGLGW